MITSPTHEDLLQLLERQGRGAPLIEAFRRTPRELFVPAEAGGRAYADEPVPIPREQVTSQPSLIALMVEALELSPGDKVLEVGTGWGFQTALLSRLCRWVYTVERFPELSAAAGENLRRAGRANVTVSCGDGTLGFPEFAPYDAIVGSAAAPRVPPPWAAQLKDGGRLVLPIGPGGGERVLVFEKRDGVLHCRRTLTRATFVRLVGRHGFPR